MRAMLVAIGLWLAAVLPAAADFWQLLSAVRLEDEAPALQLLASGEDPNPPSFHSGYAPLQFAARNGNLVLLRALLAAGAETEYRDHNGDRALLWAVAAGEGGAVSALIAAGSPVHDPADPYRRSPLLIAAEKGRSGIARHLLARGAPANDFDESGVTPLHLAARRNHPELVALLLAAGANPNVISDVLVETPLHEAALRGSRAVVDALLRAGASPRARDHAGRTALHLAALAGKADIVDALIAARVRLDPLDDDGKSPILLALEARQIDADGTRAVAALLAPYTNDRNRAFIAALDADASAVAAVLLARGIEVDFVTRDGRTPLVAAAGSRDEALLDAVIDAGADVARFGGAALVAAAHHGRLPAVLRLLAERVPADAAGAQGETALLVAAAAGQVDVVAALLAAGADPLHVDDRGDGIAAYMAATPRRIALDLEVLGRSRALRPDFTAELAAEAAALERGHAAIRAMLAERGFILPVPVE